jgi:hypothetical protein
MRRAIEDRLQRDMGVEIGLPDLRGWPFGMEASKALTQPRASAPLPRNARSAVARAPTAASRSPGHHQGTGRPEPELLPVRTQ